MCAAHAAIGSAPPPAMSAASAATTGCIVGLNATDSKTPAANVRPSRSRRATALRRSVYGAYARSASATARSRSASPVGSGRSAASSGVPPSAAPSPRRETRSQPGPRASSGQVLLSAEGANANGLRSLMGCCGADASVPSKMRSGAASNSASHCRQCAQGAPVPRCASETRPRSAGWAGPTPAATSDASCSACNVVDSETSGTSKLTPKYTAPLVPVRTA
mmetsp:Transcript_20938/g.64435  ORF Transcript_20938/g.64435 Transcript_20938/m.64435 type:complete len:221 (-) Transcript_20938:293-955(-)